MHIDKRTRAQAAQLCALMASSNADVHGEFLVDFASLQCGGRVRPASVLGCARLVAAARREWAEAEAMLRTGWLP